MGMSAREFVTREWTFQSIGYDAADFISVKARANLYDDLMKELSITANAARDGLYLAGGILLRDPYSGPYEMFDWKWRNVDPGNSVPDDIIFD